MARDRTGDQAGEEAKETISEKRDTCNSYSLYSSPLLQAKARSDERLALVNDFAVEEVQVNVGELHFGHGIKAKATIAVWRDRQHERPICGEFAFQCKFDRREDLHRESLKRAADFYKTLQLDAYEWVTLGATKTAIVYGLGQQASTNHE